MTTGIQKRVNLVSSISSGMSSEFSSDVSSNTSAVEISISGVSCISTALYLRISQQHSYVTHGTRVTEATCKTHVTLIKASSTE